jgi:hypothetical protein
MRSAHNFQAQQQQRPQQQEQQQQQLQTQAKHKPNQTKSGPSSSDTNISPSNMMSSATSVFQTMRKQLQDKATTMARKTTSDAPKARPSTTGSTRAMSTQANAVGKRTIEDWDYKCIDLCIAWH